MSSHRTTSTNVLVIGTGGAGCRAAIAAHDAGCEVRMLGRRRRDDPHTVLAAGGINAALGSRDPDDSEEWHFRDTWNEGYFLADARAVEVLVTEAPARIRELADWGMPFARTDDGEIDQRYFGAHTYRRTCYAGDFTGRAMARTLHGQVSRRGIRIEDGVYVTRLLVCDETCFGVLAFDLDTGERVVHLADAVVLAGGGHTRLWRRSSSRRDENGGDAMQLALRAGAELVDLELVQFHPTGMTHPSDSEGQLVSEAVRGEGGRLFNNEGERFMERYDPDRMELSTRDLVAKANFTEIKEGRHGPNGGVFLDLSHLDETTIRAKVPRMYRQFAEIQLLDISEEPMEVAPTAHYSMGGVAFEPETAASSVDGLFVAGEITGGVHGGNRLGGNSLVETLVFGRRAGAGAAARSRRLGAQPRSSAVADEAMAELDDVAREGEIIPRLLQHELREAVWDHLGVVRDEDSIAKGIERLDDLAGQLDALDVRPDAQGYGDVAIAIELRGSFQLARATAMAALERRESRGAHQRSDHPDRDDDRQLVNYVVTASADGALHLDGRPRRPIPEHLQAWATEADTPETGGKLVE